ncbi:MAG: hypothetical protein ACLGHN_03310 [Bacteriovoracia bacterium]
MKAIRVNADYELTLAGKKGSSHLISESLEFIAFYLDERPLSTAKKYAPEFLEHVSFFSGHAPQIINTNHYENWWGPLENIALEQKINSKEFTAEFDNDCQVIRRIEDLKIVDEKVYLAKAALGMSGQDIVSFRKGDEDKLQSLLGRSGSLIIEPLYDRRRDFSHYVFPSGETICYENLVNSGFQYKGTLFTNLHAPVKEGLRFYSEVPEDEWKNFEDHVLRVTQSVRREGAGGGFSLDSFSYQEEGKQKIRSVSEINYRKTMGLVTWLLSQKFCKGNSWSLLILGKTRSKGSSFEALKNSIEPVAFNPNSGKGCLLLSPGDTRFEAFFLSANSHEEGKDLFQKLKQLLPDTQFTIEI